MRVYRFPLAILFLWLASTSVRAQLSDYGIKFGLQSASIQSFETDIFDTQEKLGAAIYGFAEFRLPGIFTTELQLGYALRGFSNSILITGPDSPVPIQRAEPNTSLHYASSVLLLKSNFRVAGQKVYAGAGPRIEYLISSNPGTWEYENPQGGTDTFSDATAELLDDTLLGSTFVIGASTVPFAGAHYIFELRYDLDITDSMSNFSRDARNRGFMFSVGIGFK